MKKIRKDVSKVDIIIEQEINTVPISEEMTQEYRDTTGHRQNNRKSNMINWSAPQDRSEDLATLMDPLIQQPERETQVPPELPQEREDGFASRNDLSETSEDLSHLFDRERKAKNGRTR